MHDYFARKEQLRRNVFMSVEMPETSSSCKYGKPLDVETMLDELKSWQLQVVLTPAPDPRHSGHSIRTVAEQNPKWYRDFCALYQSNRKGAKWRTRIKRQATIQALERILQGETSGIYVERLLDFIEQNSGSEEIPF